MRVSPGSSVLFLLLMSACESGADPQAPEAQFGMASSTAPAKADVCHKLGNGSFALLNVSSKALPAHRQHGDGLPGETLPTDASKKFTATCALEPATVCPCTFTPAAIASLNQVWGDLGTDYEYYDGWNVVQLFSRTLPTRWDYRFLAFQAPKDNWPQAFSCTSRVYQPNRMLNLMEVIYEDEKPVTAAEAAVCRRDLPLLAGALLH